MTSLDKTGKVSVYSDATNGDYVTAGYDYGTSFGTKQVDFFSVQVSTAPSVTSEKRVSIATYSN